jgi:subtilisin family serine protease
VSTMHRKSGQRKPSRRLITALVVSAVVGALVAPDARAGEGLVSPSVPDDNSVTLLTGDRVVLDGDRLVSYVPAPGRERVPMRTYTERGHRYVVPADAAPLVASGKVDRRLFDVTAMAGFGYDDAKRATVPVLVRRSPVARADMSVLSGQQNVPAVEAVAGTVDKSGVGWAALRSGVLEGAVEKIWLDGMSKLALDRSTAQIGAPKAWQAGFTGKGVRVAVLDGGVDEKHPDLVGRQVAERDFTGSGNTTDEVGHGTHVAATIASTDKTHRGVAPDAELLDAKVCTPGGCPDSAVLEGMRWAVEQGAHVINMSLGRQDTPEIDPLEEAVDRITRESGVLFVVAAGNEGEPETIDSPGSADSALSVGAVDRDDHIASYSSRGPSAAGAIKPDVTAPGTGIVAAQAGSTGRVARSGTSMATPHVAGVVALLKQQHPDWTAARLKGAVMASAVPRPGATPFDQGAGRVDVPKALAQRVIAEPANLNLGVRQWPHEDDEKVVREITYRNFGDAPVTLDLSTEITGPGGRAPAGMFTLSPAKLTVAAGGEAKAVLITDTTVPATDGVYSGEVLASGVRTLVSVNREVESYDISLSHLGIDGRPAPGFETVMIDVGSGKRFDAWPGSTVLRLPKGEYRVESGVWSSATEYALLVQPRLVVNGKGEFVFDARQAKPVVLRAPEPSATSMLASIWLTSQVAGKVVSTGYGFTSGFNGVSLGQVGPDSPGFSTSIGEQFQGAAATYRLLWTERGRVPTGYDRTAQRSELAEMVTTFPPGGSGKRYQMGTRAVPHDGSDWLLRPTPVSESGRATDFVTAASAEWHWVWRQLSGQDQLETVQVTRPRALTAGRTYHQKLNTAVFGPSVPPGPEPELAKQGLVRQANNLVVSVPMFTDSNGGAGSSATSSARVTLFRDGVKAGESAGDAAAFEVPRDESTYRAEVTLERTVSDLATKVSGVWTFRSGFNEGVREMPMSVVRFAPRLENDTARGNVLRIPLQVQQQKGTPKVRRVEVEASFDDGATWCRVPVAANNAVVRHEPGAKFASLRARTTDAAGNTGEVTIIRAYRIAR